MTLATATDTGNGYGARGCAAAGCGAILAYPDEGMACERHTCGGCGEVVDELGIFSQPYRDERGAVYLDPNASACLACYAAIMEALPLGRMLRVEYRRRG